MQNGLKNRAKNEYSDSDFVIGKIMDIIEYLKYLIQHVKKNGIKNCEDKLDKLKILENIPRPQRNPNEFLYAKEKDSLLQELIISISLKEYKKHDVIRDDIYTMERKGVRNEFMITVVTLISKYTRITRNKMSINLLRSRQAIYDACKKYLTMKAEPYKNRDFLKHYKNIENKLISSIRKNKKLNK